MGVVAGFQPQPQETAVNIRALAGTLVVNRHHVAAFFGDEVRYRFQLAGFVQQLHRQLARATGGEQTAFDHAGQDGHIDVAAGHQADDLFALDRHLME